MMTSDFSSQEAATLTETEQELLAAIRMAQRRRMPVTFVVNVIPPGVVQILRTMAPGDSVPVDNRRKRR